MEHLEMENKHYKTIIVGAGPAGATCGYVLAKNNEECLIIEKNQFPRQKLCGGGLTGKAFTLLEEIYGKLDYNYCPVHRMDIHWKGEEVCKIPLRDGIRTVVRKDFDHLLLNKYLEVGGKLLYDKAMSIAERDGKVFVSLRSGEELSCDTLVGADSANSIIRRYLEPRYHKGIVCLEKQTADGGDGNIKVLFDNKIKGGYFYSFPNPKGSVVGCGYIGTKKEMFEKYLKVYKIEDDNKINGAYIPMKAKFRYPFKKNILLIGDAGGYADAMTGEGLYHAFRTGSNAASSIMTGVDFRQHNMKMIKKVKRSKLMARTFYFYPIHKLFLRMCRSPRLLVKISHTIDRYLMHR